MPYPLSPTQRSPKRLPASYRLPRARTHRLKNSYSSLVSASPSLAASPFSFSASATTGLKPPPVAVIADNGGKTRRVNAASPGMVKARIVDWSSSPLVAPVILSPSIASITDKVGEVNETLTSLSSSSLPSVSSIPVVDASTLDSPALLASDMPSLDLSEVSHDRPTAFRVKPHPNDSPALGSPLTLNGEFSLTSSSSVLRRSPLSTSTPITSGSLGGSNGASLLPPVSLAQISKSAASSAAQRVPVLSDFSNLDLEGKDGKNLGSSRRRQQSVTKFRSFHDGDGQVPSSAGGEQDDTPSIPRPARQYNTRVKTTRPSSLSSSSSVRKLKHKQSQVASSPSLDITSAFPSLASLSPSSSLSLSSSSATVDAGLGLGLGLDLPTESAPAVLNSAPDVHDLFDEAFPSPSLSALFRSVPTSTAVVPTTRQSKPKKPHHQHHRRTTTGLKELELVRRRLSWETVVEDMVEEKEDGMDDVEGTVKEEERFEDAREEEVLAPTLLPSLSLSRRHTPTPSPSLSVHNLNMGTGFGLGLGIDFDDTPAPVATPTGLGLGLGIAFGEQEEEAAEVEVEGEVEVEATDPGEVDLSVEVQKRSVMRQHLDKAYGEVVKGKEEVREEFLDPETPILSPIANSIPAGAPQTPTLPDHVAQEEAPKHVSPRKIIQRSPPRAKKVSLQGKGALKRIYPRPLQLEIEVARRRNLKVKPVGMDPPARSQEDTYYGSPNLNDLPGSFLASPVLPTSFGDFSHSPLPTPPTRFSRVRRNSPGQQQTAPLPTFMPTSLSAVTLPPTTTPGPAETAPPSPLLLTTSPAGTPSMAASPTFSPALAPLSPSIADTEAFPSSAPGTPVPDQAVAAASSATAAAAAAGGGQQMSQAVFDAAIASTILGAVAAIGVLGWLAMSVFRRKKDNKGISSRGIGNYEPKRFSEEKEDAYAYAVAARQSAERDPPLTNLPKMPPMATVARLSFPPSTQRQGSPTAEKTFSSHFDGWIDVSPLSKHGGATEDHGGYPDEVMRADGMSTYERRMSRQSRMSIQSGYTSTSRHQSQQQPPRSANRSSYRSSIGPSMIESTWSRPGTAMSSRTSHHAGSHGGDCFTVSAEAGAPPRLPETIPPRVSGDALAYFATPPGTPTKQGAFFSTGAGNRSSGLQYITPSSEPPVPTLPSELRDYPIPPVPSSAPASSRNSTRARSGSRSTPSKASKLPLKSALKSMPTFADSTGAMGESPVEATLKKLERRRATVDGGILADGLQALLFQAQLDSPPTPTLSKEVKDVFASSTPIGPSNSNSKRSSLNGSAARSLKSSTPGSSSSKKVRPQTMPPKIVVSDHPQPAAPPTPARKRTSTVDTDILDARASMKTLESLPWLNQSPSQTFSCHPRDDISVVDPDMRYERKHFSSGTAFSATNEPVPALPARLSKDFSSFVAAGIAASQKHAPLDSIDIASRRLASEDDLTSQSSIHEHDGDSDEEEAMRTQRRKTLLYSVYKQRGVDLSSAPSPASSATVTLGDAASPSSSASRTTDSEDSSFDSPTKGARLDALVSSFPSPPPVPTASSFSNLAANIDGKAAKRLSAGAIDVGLRDRTASAESLKAIARNRTYEALVGQASSERDITSAFTVGEGEDDDDELHISISRDNSRLSASPSSSAPLPPRPPKSPVRLSTHIGTATSAPSPPTAPPSRLPLATRSPVRTPLAPISANTTRAPSPAPLALKAVLQPAPVRNFAAELQESVGNPADGYDSDTLMSALAFNKPGHSLWSSINGHHESLSTSSSAYDGGFTSSASLTPGGAHSPVGSTMTTTSGIYSTNPASMESLEEAAIAQAETVQFGRSRASGIPQFNWRQKAMQAAPAGDESEESSYEESDAETLMWRTRMGTIPE
ncbi:hypothetical protein JCM11641_001109 [Rhodosporidiobolus odoratus]